MRRAVSGPTRLLSDRRHRVSSKSRLALSCAIGQLLTHEGFLEGKQARMRARRSQAERREAVIGCFVRYFGQAAARPEQYVERDWMAEEFTAGCYDAHFGPEPTYVALANSWIVINAGGGPTDDKPTVTLETPRDPDRVSSFLNIRVKDIEAVYAEWSARGAQFLTPPKQHQYEKRCYIRDPHGHLIEVGQTTDPQGDWSPAHWPSSTPAED